MNTKEKMIYEVRSLSFAYDSAPERKILDSVSFSLGAGEILSILGPNGSGKSTLLNCLAGIFTPTQGDVLLAEKNSRSYSAKEMARLVAYVPQVHVPEFAYTVFDFVTMGRAPDIGIFSRPGKEDRAIAAAAIESLGIEHLADKVYTEISGGERQQVMIARAVAQRPKAILFDEPTSHLDFGNQHTVLSLIRKLSTDGYGIIMTTHNPDHALLLGRNAAVIARDGTLRTGLAHDIITTGEMQKLYGADIAVTRVESAGRDVCIASRL